MHVHCWRSNHTHLTYIWGLACIWEGQRSVVRTMQIWCVPIISHIKKCYLLIWIFFKDQETDVWIPFKLRTTVSDNVIRRESKKNILNDTGWLFLAKLARNSLIRRVQVTMIPLIQLLHRTILHVHMDTTSTSKSNEGIESSDKVIRLSDTRASHAICRRLTVSAVS